MSEITRQDVLKILYSGEKTLAGLDLSGLDLSELDLTNVVMDRCNVCRTRFNGSKMVGASLKNTNATLASFVGVDASKAKFDGSVLEHSNFKAVNLSGASLNDADLSEAAFGEAKTGGASFVGAWRQRRDDVGNRITNRPNVKPKFDVPRDRGPTLEPGRPRFQSLMPSRY